tara:strand:+ start:1593 stop:2126 length:534 start_codon:yes stop_codon:yes gene_type:complete
VNCKNPKDWKTDNPIDDAKKFALVRNYQPEKGAIKRETLDLQILQVQTIHKNFPHVRFYGFHKTAKEFAEKHYGCMWDYSRCKRLPDGYFFSYPESETHPDIPWNPSIFIIEIENYSRVDESRTFDYWNWWSFFDGIEYTALHIMEFNRFGEFQRDIIKETHDKRESVEILKERSEW